MIVNLTIHPLSTDQVAAGIVDTDVNLKPLLVFSGHIDRMDTLDRAHRLAVIASDMGATKAMIGGALWLMGPLEQALRAEGVMPVFAQSDRIVIETTLPDGTVRKTADFRHLGTIEGVTSV